MKVKLPPAISHKKLQEQWIDGVGDLTLSKGKTIKISYSESQLAEQKRRRVLYLLNKYKQEIEELEGAMLDYLQTSIHEFPSVSLVPISKKSLNTEGEYLSARLSYPLKGGEEKTYRLYLGKKENFGDLSKRKNIIKVQEEIGKQLKRKIKSDI